MQFSLNQSCNEAEETKWQGSQLMKSISYGESKITWYEYALLLKGNLLTPHQELTLMLKEFAQGIRERYGRR
jgi:hypothetical protein